MQGEKFNKKIFFLLIIVVVLQAIDLIQSSYPTTQYHHGQRVLCCKNNNKHDDAKNHTDPTEPTEYNNNTTNVPYKNIPEQNSAEDLTNDPYKLPATLTGTLKSSIRPAPDIAYDFIIELEEPIERMDGSGEPGDTYEVYVVNSDTMDFSVRLALYENIDKRVTLEGYREWGYAEGSHFVTQELIPLE